MPLKHKLVFNQYCLDCHGSDTKEGNIDHEYLSFTISEDIVAAERWAKVLNAINSGEMPPEDSEQLVGAKKSAFLRDLSEQMVVARRRLSDTGGVIILCRLNRRE